ncbi:MAG: hypothetical protein HC781_10525 [Leptolyngbyaceae cyanobacterium CSU_1_4]|nr:hypothetical protein [Leptolyngbyaceae cyanobacterium CSU_1_4]
MMTIDLMQQMTGLVEVNTWADLHQGLLWQLHWDWNHLAQFNTDVFAATRGWFDNFLKTGQVWALIIGLVLGFMLRGMTSYG